jgi:cobalt/nickel transport system permease protein
MLLDPYRFKASVLHSLDARVKLVLTLAFLISLNLTPPGAWPAYVLFFSGVLAATVLAQVGIRYVWTRSLLALPFVLAALPLVFTAPGPAWALSAGDLGQVGVSQAGLERFTSIAFKSWISVQAAVLLSATTRFTDLAAALRALGAPRLLVAVTALMWRYLFLLVGEAQRMLRARESRSPSPEGTNSRPALFGRRGMAWRARVAGGMAGSLFVRSLERSERVHAAMLARGYNGEPMMRPLARLSGADLAIISIGIFISSLLLLLGLAGAAA